MELVYKIFYLFTKYSIYGSTKMNEKHFSYFKIVLSDTVFNSRLYDQFSELQINSNEKYIVTYHNVYQ